jgi:uncharacterized membrane protein
MSNGRSRLINIILVCSLATNLLLVGGIVGHLANRPPPRPLPDHLGWMFRNLDDARRHELRDEFEAHARKMRPLRREMRGAQRDFERAVLTDEFDPDSVREALARLRESSADFQAAMHGQMVNVLARLDENERKQLLQFLGRRDRGPGRGGPPPGESSPP